MTLTPYDRFIKFLATGLHSSSVPPWPGTSGTIPAWLIAFFLIRGDMLVLIPVTVITFFLSVWICTSAENFMGHDSRYIVMDEWAGMFVCVLFVPYSLTNYLIAFIVFRILDAIKIYPAAQLEELPGGWGVTMDDIVAGVQTNLLIQVYLLIRSYM